MGNRLSSTAVVESERVGEALLLLDIATDFRRNGWADKARRFARRALAIVERESGTDHPDVVRVLLCLAGAREDLADYARAEAEYLRADDILGRLDDTSSLEVQRLRIQTTRGLANVARAMGRDNQAETMLERALSMAERTFGGEQTDVAGVLNDLGVHYRRTGRYDKASRAHRRALAITEKALGPEHPQAAAILHDLGILEHARGQFSAGEPFARRAVSIRERTLGPDHPQVAADFMAVAALLEGQGRFDEAESTYQRALTMLEHWFGPDHREVSAAATHLLRISDRVGIEHSKHATGAVRCA
jgi:tetratricopeptide (TPR) repeat protein